MVKALVVVVEVVIVGQLFTDLLLQTRHLIVD